MMSSSSVTDEERDLIEKTKEISIELLPVKSGNINSVGYSAEHQLLRILFKNGALYQYTNVPPEAYEQLVKADSVGSVFARTIRNFYKYTRM
jgi:hypothetical protein